MYVPFELTVTVPLLGLATFEKVSEVESTSVAVNVPFLTASSLVEIDTAVATGASLTAVTVMETVTVAESNAPSLALKVKESLPLKLALGVYV